ncbi:hypothetical protein ES707_16591 [subsurface metagenome]
MEQERNAKEYAWKWITASELLCRSACDLVDAHLVPDAAGFATAVFYNGEDTNGEIILSARVLGITHCDLHPNVPIYCRRGLYIDIVTNTRGILVQWRPRASKEG